MPENNNINNSNNIQAPDNNNTENPMQKLISDAVSAALKDENFINGVIAEEIKKAVKDIVAGMFSWGEVKDAIKTKLTDAMAPAIEKYDFTQYVTKLDGILTELLKDPDFIANKKILANFKTAVTPPDVKYVSPEELLKEFCKYVGSDIDTDGRDISYDDGEPYYEPVECVCESENIRSEYCSDKNYERYLLKFFTEEEDLVDESRDKLAAEIELYRWSWMESGQYHISIRIDPRSLKFMTDFEAYAYSLSLANITVFIDKEDLDRLYITDTAEIEKRPEPHYE